LELQENPDIKFYQASTRELYGRGNTKSQTEKIHSFILQALMHAKLYG